MNNNFKKNLIKIKFKKNAKFTSLEESVQK